MSYRTIDDATRKLAVETVIRLREENPSARGVVETVAAELGVSRSSLREWLRDHERRCGGLDPHRLRERAEKATAARVAAILAEKNNDRADDMTG